MSQSLIELQAKIREAFLRMQALRDDVRERLNAGGMEEWAEWQKLESEAVGFELDVAVVSDDLWRRLVRLGGRLSKLRDDLFSAATTPSSSRTLELEASASRAAVYW